MGSGGPPGLQNQRPAESGRWVRFPSASATSEMILAATLSDDANAARGARGADVVAAWFLPDKTCRVGHRGGSGVTSPVRDAPSSGRPRLHRTSSSAQCGQFASLEQPWPPSSGRLGRACSTTWPDDEPEDGSARKSRCDDEGVQAEFARKRVVEGDAAATVQDALGDDGARRQRI